MNHPVVLFDGVCNFCNASVNFIIKRDPKHLFRFAALQSDAGIKLLTQLGLSTTSIDTIVLVIGDQYYTRSSAALRIARRLSGLWPLLFGFIIVPAFIRDALYNLIARHRYNWFGKQDTCMVPTPEVRSRFLD